MEKTGKGSFFILLIIIAVLTLIIAVLAAFIALVGFGNPASAAAAGGNRVEVLVEPPKTEDLTSLVLIEDGSAVNLKMDAADNNRAHYAQIAVTVNYFTKVNGVKDTAAMMTHYLPNMKEIVTTYFMEMTVTEFANFETKAQVKEELKQALNNYLISTVPDANERNKINDIIYDVVFSAWNYQ